MFLANRIVCLLIEDRLAEVLGAVNFWVDADGKEYRVAGHVDWAAGRLKLRLSPTGQDSWEVQESVYQEMFKRGWMRVAIVGKEMLLDYRRMTTAQRQWAEDKAIRDSLKIIDDRGVVIADWSTPPGETPGESSGSFSGPGYI